MPDVRDHRIEAESSDDQPLLSAHDLADMLRVSTRTLYRWIDQGHLIAPLRIGGVLRWRRRDVQAWLDRAAHES